MRQGCRDLAGAEGLDEEVAVADLAALLRAEEAAELLGAGAAELGGLAEEGLPGAVVALGVDELLDAGGAERADQFVLQVVGAGEDRVGRGARAAEPRS